MLSFNILWCMVIKFHKLRVMIMHKSFKGQLVTFKLMLTSKLTFIQIIWLLLFFLQIYPLLIKLGIDSICDKSLMSTIIWKNVTNWSLGSCHSRFFILKKTIAQAFFFLSWSYFNHIDRLTLWTNEQSTTSIGGLPQFTEVVFRKQ